MQLVDTSISLDDLRQLALERFGQLIKAVVDIEREVMVVDAELHADQEQYLLDHGSKQKSLWGINLYPDVEGEDWLEFDSMINVRPSDNNFSREVENEEIKKQIQDVVNKLVKR